MTEKLIVPTGLRGNDSHKNKRERYSTERHLNGNHSRRVIIWVEYFGFV